MIVVDASVVLAFLALGDPHHQSARRVLVHDEEFGIHGVTLAECLVRGEREGRLDEVASKVAGLGIVELDRVPAEARLLARARVATGLKLPDCCVLVAAEAATGRLATFDSRLARVARERGLTVVGDDDEDR